MEMWVKVLHSICNMGTRGLPDMYTLGPRACGPRAPGCAYQADHPCPCYKYCNMGTRGLPDMYTLGPRAPGCTYQADHPCPCYKY